MEHVYDESYDIGVCKVCGLVEGSLTTDCPQENSYREYSDDVYNGFLDYIESEGWVRGLNDHSWWRVYGKIFDLLSKRTDEFEHENEIMLKYGLDKEKYREIEKHVLQDVMGRG